MDQLRSFELLCQYVTPVDVQVHPPGREPLFKDHDWEAILKLADGYLVTPSLYLGLQRRGLLDYLDKDLREHLAAIYLLNRARNAKIKTQALATIELLNSEAIQPVLLKGIAGLLTGLYEDDGERFMGDIDLMVEKSELIQVVELLTTHDYECDPGVRAAVLNHSFYKHELSLLPNAGGVKIDLHVRPTGSSGYQAFVSSDGARRQASPLVVGTATALLPPPEFRLMHNFYHAQSLDRCYLTGSINLRQLIDWSKLWRMNEAKVSYTEINDALGRHRLCYSFALYVFTAEQLLMHPVPAGVTVGGFINGLFLRQQLCLQHIWFYKLNQVVVFLLKGGLSFTPERVRLKFGDLPTVNLVILVARKYLDSAWYIRRFYQVKSHVICFIR